MSENEEKGRTLIERLVDIALISIRSQTYPSREAVAKGLKWFWHQIVHPQELEHAKFIKKITQYETSAVDFPDFVRETLEPLLNPTEQFWAGVANSVASTLATSPLGTLMTSWLAGWQRDYMLRHAPMVLPPDLAIRYASGDPRQLEDTITRLREQGFEPGDAYTIFKLSKVYPDVNTLRYELLLNRVNDLEARQQLNWQGYNDLDAMSWLESITDVLSINNIVTGIYREYLSPGAAQFFAAKLGYDAQTLNNIVELSRPTLPASDAVRAYWRGTLTADGANWHIKASGYPLQLAQTIEELTRPRATVDDLVTNFFRGKITLAEIETELVRRGYTVDDIGQMVFARYPTLDPGAIRQAALRGLITWDVHDKLLGQLGFNWSQIDIIKKLYQIIPSVSDLIVMAVRDTWNEQAVQTFGYDEDYPEEVGIWTAKQGMPDEWARRYWRAHWQLPSPQMGYEMLHRGVIDKPTLELLLRIADWPRFWRDKLIAISYNPYTRVDIRRMFQTGVLNRDEVYKAYKDIGYDDEHAAKLTQFTVSLASTNERDLSTSDLITAYKDGIIDRETLKHNLELAGFDANESELQAAKADYDIHKSDRTATLDAWKALYFNGELTIEQLNNLMLGNGMTQTEINRLLPLWRLEYATKAAKLSLSELLNMHSYKIIDNGTLDEELAKLGYNKRYRDWIIQLANKKAVVL
jgi:Ca2+-binding EF-hand superfamily protein/PAS domain-containing protein